MYLPAVKGSSKEHEQQGFLSRPPHFSSTKMAAEMGSESLLSQADSMWKMLDDLAESDPEAYKRFMDKTLKEGSSLFKPPEPCFCISTVLVSNDNAYLTKKTSPQEARSSLALASNSIKLKAVPAVSETDYYIFVCSRAFKTN